MVITNDDKRLIRKQLRHLNDEEFNRLTDIVQHLIDVDENVLYCDNISVDVLEDIIAYLAYLPNKPFVQQYIRKVKFSHIDEKHKQQLEYCHSYECLYIGVTMWQVNNNDCIIKLPPRDDATYLTAGPPIRWLEYYNSEDE